MWWGSRLGSKVANGQSRQIPTSPPFLSPPLLSPSWLCAASMSPPCPAVLFHPHWIQLCINLPPLHCAGPLNHSIPNTIPLLLITCKAQPDRERWKDRRKTLGRREHGERVVGSCWYSMYSSFQPCSHENRRMHVMDMKNTTPLKTLPWPCGCLSRNCKSFILVIGGEEREEWDREGTWRGNILCTSWLTDIEQSKRCLRMTQTSVVPAQMAAGRATICGQGLRCLIHVCLFHKICLTPHLHSYFLCLQHRRIWTDLYRWTETLQQPWDHFVSFLLRGFVECEPGAILGQTVNFKIVG